jgi:NRPS condensation-like uncharacterized protein
MPLYGKESDCLMIKEAITEKRWFKLDNAAKIYPIIHSAKTSGLFRMSVNMKELVDPMKLKEAILACKNRFPSFFVRLRRGFFWYYYDTNEKDPLVFPESPYICQSINVHSNNHHLFTFFFHETKISMEMFHSLADGSGALEFLKAVIFKYLESMGKPQVNDGTVFKLDDLPDQEELVDSYKVYYKEGKIIKDSFIPAYHITGKNYKRKGISINTGLVDAAKLKEVARSYGASVSQFLAANLLFSIILTGDQKKLLKHPVTVSVAVNLRRHFPSKSLRNFSLYFNTAYQYAEGITFDAVLEKIKSDFAVGLTKEHLQNKLNHNMSFEKNFLIRIMPLFLKKLLMKIGYSIIAHKPITSSFTNFGEITFPKTMTNEIKSIFFNLASGSKPGIACVTLNNQAAIAFTSNYQDKSLETVFFRFLTNNGLKVKLESNYWK